MRLHTIFSFVFLSTISALAQTTPNAGTVEFFESKIRPILANSCYSCHTTSQLGGLRLDSQEAMLKGGKRGPAVVPGDPEKSVLIAAVRQTNADLKMPMGNKLKPAEVEDLTAWVAAGAVWPKTTVQVSNTSGKYTIDPERKKFWSLQPLALPTTPKVSDAKWPKTEIDKFVLANLDKNSMKPVKQASKRDLIRRASLDLTGLPPTPEEVAAFEKDKIGRAHV